MVDRINGGDGEKPVINDKFIKDFAKAISKEDYSGSIFLNAYDKNGDKKIDEDEYREMKTQIIQYVASDGKISKDENLILKGMEKFIKMFNQREEAEKDSPTIETKPEKAVKTSSSTTTDKSGNKTTKTPHGKNSYKVTVTDKNDRILIETICENKSNKELASTKYEYDAQGNLTKESYYQEGVISRAKKYDLRNGNTITARYDNGKLKQLDVTNSSVVQDKKIYADDGQTIIKHLVRDEEMQGLRDVTGEPYIDSADSEFYGKTEQAKSKKSAIKVDKKEIEKELSRTKNPDGTTTIVTTDELGNTTTKIVDKNNKTIYIKTVEPNSSFDEIYYNSKGQEERRHSERIGRREISVDDYVYEYYDNGQYSSITSKNVTKNKNNEITYQSNQTETYYENGNRKSYSREYSNESTSGKVKNKFNPNGFVNECVIEENDSERGHSKINYKYDYDNNLDDRSFFTANYASFIEYNDDGSINNQWRFDMSTTEEKHSYHDFIRDELYKHSGLHSIMVNSIPSVSNSEYRIILVGRNSVVE